MASRKPVGGLSRKREEMLASGGRRLSGPSGPGSKDYCSGVARRSLRWVWYGLQTDEPHEASGTATLDSSYGSDDSCPWLARQPDWAHST